ncbi:MAG TPA: protein translocase subunit SecF [Ktedonobacterales bacterium]|nr:protein translocase subunit SecF [Ktedonobacterales bacterium]
MFHLTKYRYVFFAISGLIIVPGLLALIFWHLNLGIDFTNGTTVNLVFANPNVTTTQIQDVFTSAHANDVSVYASQEYRPTCPVATSPDEGACAIIQFSRPIGTAEESDVVKALQKLDPKATSQYPDYELTVNGKSIGQLVILFDKPVKKADIQAALANLPPTDLPPGDTGLPGGTATPAATASPSATATATATATGTPGATATPSASSSGQTFPVSVTSVSMRVNGTLYEVDTQTDLVNTPEAGATVTLPAIVDKLQAKFGPVYVQQKSAVGPAIAGQTTISAILAVIIASLGILLYIGFAFRHVGSFKLSLRFGASAVIALLHDAFVVLGLWAIFGKFFNFKVDTLFLTAVLTVIGFSVHDTIVVFDRIRENLGRRSTESFDSVVNTSLIQTMSRSLNTSLTVLIVLAAETLFGGESIREFVLALLIGIASGTYSSIFNASMVLSVWENKEYRNWFRRRPATPKAPAKVVASARR